jgi:hypothetical protein
MQPLVFPFSPAPRHSKALSYTDWAGAKWSVVRKGGGQYPASPKLVWQELDRRRLLLVGVHDAVFEVIMAEPTVNAVRRV